MLEAAKAKIDGISPSAVTGGKVADISVHGWSLGLGSGEFDAVVSTLVLEHLDFESYRAAIGTCFHLLRPGGWLIAAEGYAEEESDMVGWFSELMEARRELIDDPELSDFVSGLRAKEEVHHYASKAEKAAWWREAGIRPRPSPLAVSLALMAGQRPVSFGPGPPLSSYPENPSQAEITESISPDRVANNYIIYSRKQFFEHRRMAKESGGLACIRL